MRKKTYKGRCEKRSLEKFTSICKTYDPIQSAYANILVKNKDIAEVRCNITRAQAEPINEEKENETGKER